MAKRVHIKDTDYLFLSAYIHAKEPKLIGRDRLERMLEAKTAEDSLKVLEENGWTAAGGIEAGQLEKLLSKRREDVFGEMRAMAPDPKIVDLFMVKYDYHNAKVLIKAQGMGISGKELLSSSGRISSKKLSEATLEGSFGDMPKTFAASFLDATNTLSRTGDPQIADFVLDKAYFAELYEIAVSTGSDFLVGYVKLSIDAANLRSVVRAVRMKKDVGFLKQALVPGGTVSETGVLSAFDTPETALELFGKTQLRKIIDGANAAVRGGKLTEFEKQCDNALTQYLSEAKRVGFNEKPLIVYLCAVEAEISSIRIVMAGQFAGLTAEKIKERLREGV